VGDQDPFEVQKQETVMIAHALLIKAQPRTAGQIYQGSKPFLQADFMDWRRWTE
jgi:hypothetical protein